MAPTLISQPTRITAAGNKPKLIDEYIGRVNSKDSAVSVAHMRSPQGWVEPGQKPEFDEFTVVLRGMLRVKSESDEIDVTPDKRWSRMPASGCSTPRRARMAPSTSPSACRRFRWIRCIAMSKEGAVKFARWVFLLAGIIGLIEVTPMFFLENKIGIGLPPPITHPEFYYGFVVIVLAWQIAFLIISRDPERYVAADAGDFSWRSRCIPS